VAFIFLCVSYLKLYSIRSPPHLVLKLYARPFPKHVILPIWLVWGNFKFTAANLGVRTRLTLFSFGSSMNQ